MAEEIKVEVIKKTQKSLGKYIKKPPLTEKLLRKPPFRFLHDIISAVITETGFLANLFSDEELNADIKGKEAKIAFLTKLINVVSSELKVRPSKVIAGLEPTKTNELLQAIAKALEKNIDSAEAVNHYKSSLEKDSRNLSKSTESKQEVPKPVAAKPNAYSKGTSERNDTVGEPKRASTRKERERTDIAGKKDTASSKKPKQVRRAKNVTVDTPRLKNSIDASANNASVNEKSSTESSKRTAKTKSAHVEIGDATETQPPQSSLEDQKRSEDVASEAIKIAAISEPSEENHSGSKNTQNVPGDAQLSENPPEIAQPSVSEKEASASKDSSPLVHGRPASARPAAPKLRWKLNVGERLGAPEVPETEIPMVDDFDDRNDDKESMVVMETDASDYSVFKDRSRNLNADATQEHGYLVAQILETQRELAKTDTVDLISNKDASVRAIDSSEPERSSQKNSETIAKEVDKLQSTIQTLTRATHPLGKLLDFLQEDVELMEKELSEWQNQSGQLAIQLENEKTKSEAAVHPLNETYNGIQASIDEQLNKIYQIKYNITRNNHKIQQLLSGRS